MSLMSGFRLGSAGYAPIHRNISKQEEAAILRAFHSADEGSKGYLTRFDMKVAIIELFGYKPTKYEANSMMERFGERIDEETVGVNLESFLSCMSEKMVKRDEDEEIRHIFMALDVHCHGFLTLEDVKKVFSKVAPHVPMATVHSAFREIDQDGDGRVSYKDFDFMMKYNTDDHI